MDDFWWGVSLGAFLFGVMHWLVMRLYNNHLAECARAESAVRINDRFYYLVTEEFFNDAMIARLQQEDRPNG